MKGGGCVNIHLYAIALGRPLSDAEVDTLMRFLPDERRKRLEKMPRPELRFEPLCAYAALRLGLYELYGWKELPEITCSKYGKPSFLAHSDVRFNISHTRGAVLVGIHDESIGVDIEKVRPVSERTMQRIAGVSTEREFFESWVRRESRGKWGGSGLAAMREEDSPTMYGERFHFVETFPGYVACVCTHSDAEIEPLKSFTLK